MMDYNWNSIVVSEDETHHLFNEQPIYSNRFNKVLKFHSPGFAPVVDGEGAYHICINGDPVYQSRFLQTFGYYENIAAVESSDGWFHVDINGDPIYDLRYAWCGNFQEGLCVVKDLTTHYYYHIDRGGRRVYKKNYVYVGDYRDGIAVVCDANSMHTHINRDGSHIHGKWFLGLDVFHKSVARAKDSNGWFHVDRQGKALYSRRYKVVEPYYNNVAHAEDFDGSLLTIDLTGKPVTVLYKNNHSWLHELSADLVGFWKTQTIYAAVNLDIFNVVPDSLDNIANAVGIDKKNCQRLLRALHELVLIEPVADDQWQATPKGSLLKSTKDSSMADAAIVWGGSHYQRWSQLTKCLREAMPHKNNYFERLADNEDLLPVYQRALSGYALQDYAKVRDVIDWSQHAVVIDAGGGTGALLHCLLDKYEHLAGILLDMPAVISLVEQRSRCCYYGVNFLKPWPCKGDAILLARVLHDWDDEQAAIILKHAKSSLLPKGKIYLLEMVLDPQTSLGGLLDLNMLVMTGGRERNLIDWNALAASVGLKICHVDSLTNIVNLLVLESHV